MFDPFAIDHSVHETPRLSPFRVSVVRMAGRRLVFPALTVHPLPAALAGARREAGVVLLGRSAMKLGSSQ